MLAFLSSPSPNTNLYTNKNRKIGDVAPMVVWAEVELNVAVILSCAASFKALLQSLFPSFMSSLVTGTVTRKSRTAAQNNNTFILQSRGHDDSTTGFRTVIQAGGGSPLDSKSVDSHEHSGASNSDTTATPAPGWPRMETTITVRSSKRDSVDEMWREA